MIYSYPSNRVFVVPAGTILSNKVKESKENKKVRLGIESTTKVDGNCLYFNLKKCIS